MLLGLLFEHQGWPLSEWSGGDVKISYDKELMTVYLKCFATCQSGELNVGPKSC